MAAARHPILFAGFAELVFKFSKHVAAADKSISHHARADISRSDHFDGAVRQAIAVPPAAIGDWFDS